MVRGDFAGSVSCLAWVFHVRERQNLEVMGTTTLLVIAQPSNPNLRLLERLHGRARVAVGITSESLAEAARDAEVILSWYSRGVRLEDVVGMSPKLRWVHSLSAGLDRVLFPGLVESSIVLTNGRGVFSGDLAEFVLGVVLFFAKDFRRMVKNQGLRTWAPFEVDPVRGRTLGIVGYGDIGRETAQRAHALGMRVLALRRRPELSREDECVERVLPSEGLIDLVQASDYLVLTAPLSRSTRRLIGEREIRSMKVGAVLINVGRGAVLDEAALIEALKEERIRGAGLDVYESEPLPPEHPFFTMDNVLLSPHCADHTPGYIARALEVFLDNFDRFAAGQPLRNVVDKKMAF